MAEWFKAHAWKVCIPSGIVGSNPTLSATIRIIHILTLKKPRKNSLIDHAKFNRGQTLSVVKEPVQNESVRFVFL